MTYANLMHGSYLLLLLACLIITVPLEFLFSARVYRRGKMAALAMIPMLIVFLAWDLLGIVRDHWWYAPERITGLQLGPLPIEELGFFLVIPLCGLLTYEAVGTVLRRVKAR